MSGWCERKPHHISLSCLPRLSDIWLRSFCVIVYKHGRVSCSWCVHVVLFHFVQAWEYISQRKTSLTVRLTIPRPQWLAFCARFHSTVLSPILSISSVIASCQYFGCGRHLKESLSFSFLAFSSWLLQAERFSWPECRYYADTLVFQIGLL